MHNKRILAKGLILVAVVSSASVNSMANYNNESNLLDINNNLNSLNKNKIKKENKVKNSIKELKNNTINSKEVIIVNENIIEGKIYELTLNEGDFVPNLSGNPEGYEIIRVTTNGNKKLVKTDYDNLRLSGIPKIDLSNAYSDNIPAGAFINATHLVEFKFPQGITSIGGGNDNGAFQGCSGLTGDLIIPDSVTSIGDSAFYECSGFTGSLTIPNSVTTIGGSAFSGCSGLAGSLVIPNSITNIGSWAFYNCIGFTGSLTIPNSVTSIGNNAFKGCNGLTGDLIIPDSVTSIGNWAFEYCSGFDGNLVIPDSVTTIGDGVFKGCSGLTGDLIIPDLVTSIGDSAFYECSGFTGSLTIPNSVTTIGGSAFSGCSGLSGSLVIPNSITNIGSWAFYNCIGFTGSLTIPNSVTSIGNNAFKGCNGLTGDLIIPDSVTSIGNWAFEYCSGFDGNLVIPDSVTTIGNGVFKGCSGLTGDLIIPDLVTSIGDSAFYECSGFTGSLTIPNSVTSIGNWAFNGLSKIEKIIIKVNSSDIDTNYKESIIANLPNTTQTVIDIPYDFNISGTWLEATNKTIGKPIIKNVVDGIERDLVNNKGETVSLSIPSLYQESNVSVLKDGENYILPTKNSEGKHIFIENGVYQVTITTDLGNTSIITFEVEDAQLRDAKEAVENVETSNNSIDLNNARDLVNNLPESLIKDQLQIRLNNIFPNLTLERQIATANLDLYIKSENMLLMNLSTNSITFEDYSGIDELEQSNAIKINVNSSLPYQLNAYLLGDIKNADGNNKININRLNIKDNSEVSYSEFTDINEKLVLKDDCMAGNDKEHIIDIKLKGDYAYPADIYKTVIKFEVEQK